MSLKEQNIIGITHLQGILDNVPNAIGNICIEKGLEGLSTALKKLPEPIRTALTKNIEVRKEVNADNRTNS